MFELPEILQSLPVSNMMSEFQECLNNSQSNCNVNATVQQNRLSRKFHSANSQLVDALDLMGIRNKFGLRSLIVRKHFPKEDICLKRIMATPYGVCTSPIRCDQVFYGNLSCDAIDQLIDAYHVRDSSPVNIDRAKQFNTLKVKRSHSQPANVRAPVKLEASMPKRHNTQVHQSDFSLITPIVNAL